MALRDDVAGAAGDAFRAWVDTRSRDDPWQHIADAIIPLVRAAERERCAAWHEAQAAWHEERADHPITKIDGSSSKIGHDLAAHRRRQAAWHREAAAAIRNLKEQANDG